MKQRLLWLLARLTLILSLMVLSMVPLSAFAATTPSTSNSVALHRPHFFWKPGSHRRHPIVAAAGNNLPYGGGPVMSGTTNVYAIFWEPTGNVSAPYNSLMERYFQDVGGTPLYRNNTQYTDSSGGFPSNAVFTGSWVDNSAYPESPLLDSDIQNEVTNALNANGWSPSIDNIFFVFTEAGQDLCFDGTQSECASNAFCAYHSFFGTNTIYAAMPYAASFSCDPGGPYPNNSDADLTINVTSHEQMEAATDPLLNAWVDSSNQEVGDKCAWTFGPRNSTGADVTWNSHGYLVQQEWDNHVSGCVLSGP